MSVRKIKDIKLSCFDKPSKHKEIELFCGFIKKRYSSFHHIRIFETKQLPKLQYSSLFQVILTTTWSEFEFLPEISGQLAALYTCLLGKIFACPLDACIKVFDDSEK